MEAHELLAIFDREQRIEVVFPGVQREAAGRVVRIINPHEPFGFIPYSDLDEASADAEIDEQIERFRALNMGFEWKVYDHDRPADLRQRLAARGFEIEEPEALMVLDLQEASDFYWSAETPPVERITGADGLEEMIAMEDAVWGTDHGWMRVRLGNDLRDAPDLLSMYGAREGGRLVSAAWMYFHPPSQFASLWGGSTLPEHRRRGYYTALLVARAREARQRGVRFLTVDASPMSRPVLERRGFRFLGFSTPCTWRPSTQPPEG